MKLGLTQSEDHTQETSDRRADTLLAGFRERIKPPTERFLIKGEGCLFSVKYSNLAQCPP